MDVTPPQRDKTDVLELVEAKLSALRWQGIAALLGGQAIAGLFAALVAKTGSAAAPARAAAHATTAAIQALIS